MKAESAPLLPKKSFWNLDQRKFINVLIMGFGFMMLFTAYNTTQNFVTALLSQLGFGNLGFYSLSVLYVAVSFSVGFAPLIVGKTGEKYSIWLGAFCYCVYIASLIKIYPVLVYISAVIIGFGGAILWVAQGALITKCSDETTRGRNSGIFWGIFQLSGILGNLGAFYILREYDGSVFLLFLILLICGVVGVAILLLLQNVEDDRDQPSINSQEEQRPSISEILKQSVILLGRKETLLMTVIMFYSGFELSFYSGEYPLILGDNKMIGAVMAVLGAAEVLGGLVLGKLSDILGRKVIITVAMIFYSVGLGLSWIIKLHGYSYLCYLAAICFGLGDSTFNTQLYAALGSLYATHETVAAFTVFQFLQNIGSAIGFFYSPYLPVHGDNGSFIQLILLAGIGWFGTVMFWIVKIPNQRNTPSV